VQAARHHALDGAVGAHRHEDRGFDHTVVQGQASTAGVAAGVFLEEVKFEHGEILLSNTLEYILCFTSVKVRSAMMNTVEAIVSSKGQVTLPAAMRAKLGISAGSHIHFELRGKELVIKPEVPMSAYRGMLKKYNLDPADLEIEKEPDREFE
jgi:AbrB family looped-hinge helix DNA binding protein